MARKHGQDEEPEQPTSASPRRPLVQRTALHALKTLVLKHPGAALDAAGSGAAYAVKSVAQDGLDAVKSGVSTIKDALTPASEASIPDTIPAPVSKKTAALTDSERQAFIASLDEDERQALEALAGAGNTSRKG